MNNQTTNFSGYANVSTGTNTVQIVAQDYIYGLRHRQS